MLSYLLRAAVVLLAVNFKQLWSTPYFSGATRCRNAGRHEPDRRLRQPLPAGRGLLNFVRPGLPSQEPRWAWSDLPFVALDGTTV
jgi:hypothetical protein